MVMELWPRSQGGIREHASTRGTSSHSSHSFARARQVSDQQLNDAMFETVASIVLENLVQACKAPSQVLCGRCFV
ncbi:hypothetical protein CORC01_07753 [Colletotrichum orchidophilum]|uniref:Uncharacterized protein n=1 Tax=Colletotrichum orchidophilum TaxID=1209926 RepID=A0A1G4B692_9PEZI|nr:uncharacterized protein CORC01_07753 [Colletotrichum orchidophilum]OHE96968.1 hypothetical protein CORC01_07753 [Colletotrichum orchidophilum]